MKVFEYVILKHPTDKESEDGKSSEIIIPVRTVLAKDEAGAAMLAGREIPDEQVRFIDRIEVAVRPF